MTGRHRNAARPRRRGPVLDALWLALHVPAILGLAWIAHEQAHAHAERPGAATPDQQPHT